MCGIGGYSLSSEGNLNIEILKKISTKISHRGPDDNGIYQDYKSKIGLVHTRLSIQDLSPNGHQPMLNENSDIILIFNGEIYNFKELRDELIKKGIKFKGNSDTEVLLKLYTLEGTNMLSRLNGIFAFAIWDMRDQKLFLARDNFGVKPLYYSLLDKGFFFASELKALTPIINDDNELNYNALQSYLTFLWCPGRDTPIKSVSKLLPGEAMIVQKGKVKNCWKWYQPPVLKNQSKKLITYENAILGVRKHLSTAIHRQMIADVPVGAFLSGGLDSSAIVSLASKIDKDISCFTIDLIGGQEKGNVEDLPYAKKVAKYLNIKLNVVEVDSKKMAGDIEDMVKILDEPLADPAALNVYYITKMAKEQGIKVLLAGTGGDDIFSGYRRHHALMREELWNWLPRKLKFKLYNLSSKLNQKNPITRRVTKLLSGIHLEGDARLINYFRWSRREDINKLYSKEFRSALNLSNADKTMLEFLKDVPSNASKLDRMLALEQQYFLADHNLLYTDKMSMINGIEVRVPFLDLDLVEFVYDIPDHFKQKGNQGKWILKKALKGILPNEIINRPKSGFGAPLRKWIRADLRELLGDILSFDSLKKRGLFDPNAVHKLIKDNDDGKVDASYTLLSLLCIEIWCRNFIKN